MLLIYLLFKPNSNHRHFFPFLIHIQRYSFPQLFICTSIHIQFLPIHFSIHVNLVIISIFPNYLPLHIQIHSPITIFHTSLHIPYIQGSHNSLLPIQNRLIPSYFPAPILPSHYHPRSLPTVTLPSKSVTLPSQNRPLSIPYPHTFLYLYIHTFPYYPYPFQHHFFPIKTIYLDIPYPHTFLHLYIHSSYHSIPTLPSTTFPEP